MLTPEQLEIRRSGIGSSDIAAIADLDPHRAPIDVWLDKLGLAERGDTMATWCGDRMEQPIAELYAEHTGRGVAPGPGTIVHRERTWALATPDRVASDDATGVRIVEIKNVGARMLPLWVEGIPDHVQLQVQWQLEVCDIDRADVAALLGGTDFQVFPVVRDRARAADLIARAEGFWRGNVLARVPPPHTGEQARRLAQLAHPRNSGAMRPRSFESEDLREAIVLLRRQEQALADQRARLEASAMAMIGDADGIDGCFTWKRARGDAWKAAARKRFVDLARANFDRVAAKIGDEPAEWEKLGRSVGAIPDDNEGRRFLVKRTKEERDGERERRAGALPRAESDGDAEDLRGPEEAPRGAVSDEW